jgi:hypothetical protein
MAKVVVTLDINSKPAVTLDPLILDIDVAGVETIHWVPALGSTFSFVALIFRGKNPFFNTVVSNTEITSRDTNQACEEHPYIILVESGGRYYSSEGITHGGGPTIRNN